MPRVLNHGQVNLSIKWSCRISPCMEFWIGVPVNKSRLRQWNPSNVFHLTLDEFLIFCASSRIMYCHLTRWKYCWSWVTWKKGWVNSGAFELSKREGPDQLITRYKHMERCFLVVAYFLFAPEFSQRRAVFHISPVWQRLQSRDKPREFLLPIMKGGCWSHDQEGTPYIMSLCKIREQRYGLHGLKTWVEFILRGNWK